MSEFLISPLALFGGACFTAILLVVSITDIRSRRIPNRAVAALAVLGVTYKPMTHITEESAGLFLAQELKRRGYRVLVHDFAATPDNAADLREFEVISDWEKFREDPHVGLAVVCCPWPQYRELAPRNGTRVFSPWQL